MGTTTAQNKEPGAADEGTGGEIGEVEART
jgi:hypothetical protein